MNSWLSALKPFVVNKQQWDAYLNMLNTYLDHQNKKLYQSTDMVDVYRAQGAVHLIEKLKMLRDEINAAS
jgi:hypothetical protein